MNIRWKILGRGDIRYVVFRTMMLTSYERLKRLTRRERQKAKYNNCSAIQADVVRPKAKAGRRAVLRV